MTVVVKTYRFDLPPPSFNESNYAKGHWPIIHTTAADLIDYPDLHEMLGLEMIISDRIYDGDEIHFNAKYYNHETGFLIFESDQFVPDPGDSGHSYWNSYRIASWIGSCHWEVSGPMVIDIVFTLTSNKWPTVTTPFQMTVTDSTPAETHTLIVHTIPTYCRVQVGDYWDANSGSDGTVGIPNVPEGFHSITVSKGGLDPQTVNINITEDREITINISAAPDFWTDPIGWIQFFVIVTMENLLGWTGGSFINLLHQVKSFFENSWIQISDFFSDVSQGVKDALGSTLTNIQDWLDNTFNNIGEWWDSTASGIGEWWNSTTEAVGDWWTSVSGEIGDWWTGSIGDLNEVIGGAVEGFVIWGEDLLTDIWDGIQQWVIDLITGLIESFTAGFDQGIEDQKTEREDEDRIGGR